MKIDYREFSELLNTDKPDFSYFKLNENELDKYEDLEYKFFNLLTENPSDLLIHKDNITYFIHKDPKNKEWNLTTLVDEIPTSDIRGNYKECFEDLLSQIKYADLFIELARQEKVISLNNFNEKGEKIGLWTEHLKDPLIKKEILFYEAGEKIGKYAKLFNNNEYAEIGNKENNQVFYYDKNDLNLIKGSDSMKVEVLQYFKGKINDVEFQNEQMFNTTEYLIENIENKFGEVSKEFVKDLKENIEYAGEKYDGFSYNILEESIMNSINSSDKFEDLFINYDGDDWKLNDINEKIKNGKYNFSEKNNENDLFKDLQINFEYSEKDLGFPKNTTFRGEEAYKFIKKLIEEDKKQTLSKTYLDIKYQDYYTDKIKIELGFSQFGGKEKVSDGLEYRLKLYSNGMIQHKEAAASMYHTTTEEIIKTAEERIKHIDKIMVKFREDEKKLEEKTKTTVKTKPEKEKPKRQTRSRIKSKENER